MLQRISPGLDRETPGEVWIVSCREEKGKTRQACTSSEKGRLVRISHLATFGQYPIKYTFYTMQRQINVARSKLKLFPTRALADSMGRVLDDLEKEAEEAASKQPNGRLTLGFDYVVVAERSNID